MNNIDPREIFVILLINKKFSLFLYKGGTSDEIFI